MEVNRSNMSFPLNLEKPVSYKPFHPDRAVPKESQPSAAQVGDGAIIDISEEAYKQLEFAKLTYPDGDWSKRLVEEQAAREAAWEASGAVVQYGARQVIPHIQTNDQLVRSLDGLEPNVVDAAYDIINDNLLKQDAGGLTEEQRQGLISLGIEKAKYIAANYMDEDTASRFLGAMEKIAQFSVNGVTEGTGKITYTIQQGPKVGAPDDNAVDYQSLMKSRDPGAYAEYLSMMEDGVNRKDYSAIGTAAGLFVNWSVNFYKNNPGAISQAVEDYTDWKKNNGETVLPAIYKNSDVTSLARFADSIRSQSAANPLLNPVRVEADLQGFIKRLAVSR